MTATMDPAGVAGGYTHPTPSSQIVAEMQAQWGSRPLDLTASYELCRRINAAHGRTYYAATRLLPAGKRPHVHALYAFARYADDLVDHLGLDWDAAQRRTALEDWSATFLDDLDRGSSDDPVCRAAIHTIRTLGIAHDDLRAFLNSMAMDLTVTRYATYEDLYDYVYGSAAVIGSMMLPILEPLTPEAREPAMELGVAFQLTNFIRDIAEDAERGRIYMPLEDLDRFGVTEEDFFRRQLTPEMRRLVAFQIARARALYLRAERGWGMLPPASSRCIRTAHALYAGILDEIEAADHQVFRVRAVVPSWKKAVVTLTQMGTSVPPAPTAVTPTITLDRPAEQRQDDRATNRHTNRGTAASDAGSVDLGPSSQPNE